VFFDPAGCCRNHQQRTTDCIVPGGFFFFFFVHQVRTPRDLEGLDGIVLPGGESTAMGLIGTATRSSSSSDHGTISMWDALIDFAAVQQKPVWGTCAGMILLAEHCIGTSAVIENGQALIGGMDMTVCRNYFGAQISSFEMATPAPPGGDDDRPFPGVFIRAPAILSVADDIEALGTVLAVPCRQAAATLAELDRKLANGENVVLMRARPPSSQQQLHVMMDDLSLVDPTTRRTTGSTSHHSSITLPGAAAGTMARQVICAARRQNILCTAFHPELTNDNRWHAYFVNTMVKPQSSKSSL
jgi:pyridoxal 5'-phosphate synthase pdxT subunit